MTPSPIPIDSRRITRGSPGVILDEKGRVLVCLTSGVALLGDHADWEGCVRWDLLKRRIAVARQIPGRAVTVGGWDGKPRPWTDADTLAATQWLEEHTSRKWPTSLVHESVTAIAARPSRQWDPVREYLSSLTWDPDGASETGPGPADTWLIDHMGAADTPHNRLVGRKWLISCVARAMRPGCKVDTTLVLEGIQGAGKSNALRALCADPGWFSDTRLDIGSKDAMAQLEGVWIYEVAELDSFRGKAETQIKAFLTSQVDSYRPAYGRTKQDYPRRCCFAGTTNESKWLDDRTGGRRFWPVQCANVDVSGLLSQRDNIWAHAVALYNEGASWWPDSADERALCADEQTERQSEDTWSEAVLRWQGDGRPYDHDGIAARVTTDKISTEAVLSHACKVPLERQDARAVKRISGLLRSLGWTLERRRIDGGRRYVWSPPETATSDPPRAKIQEEIGF